MHLLQLCESPGQETTAPETRIDAKLPKVSQPLFLSIDEHAPDGAAGKADDLPALSVTDYN
jgi:hypothetical protein